MDDRLLKAALSKVTQIGQQISKKAQYFNPESNSGNNFWNTRTAQHLSTFQQTNPLAVFSQAGREATQQATKYLQQAPSAPVKMLGRFGERFLGASGESIADVAQGTKLALQGTGEMIQGSPAGLGKQLRGAAKVAVSGGRLLAQTNPFVAGTKAIASIPAAENINVNIPIIDKQVNIPDLLASMMEFAKNPTWKAIYPQTSKLMGAVKLPSKVLTFAAGTSIKGGVEGLITGIAGMPDNLSTGEQIKYLRDNVIFGVGSEIVAQSLTSRGLIKAIKADVNAVRGKMGVSPTGLQPGFAGYRATSSQPSEVWNQDPLAFRGQVTELPPAPTYDRLVNIELDDVVRTKNAVRAEELGREIAQRMNTDLDYNELGRQALMRIKQTFPKLSKSAGFDEIIGGSKIVSSASASQKSIEDALNKGNWSKARELVNSLSDDDPYKMSMKPLIDNLEGSTPPGFQKGSTTLLTGGSITGDGDLGVDASGRDLRDVVEMPEWNRINKELGGNKPPVEDFEEYVLKSKPSVEEDARINVKGDTQTQQTATARSELKADEPIEKFRDWVNARRAVPIEQYLMGKEFTDLDEQGMDAFFKIQKGELKGEFADKLRGYYDTKYGLMQEENIRFNYQEDYLPQQWKNTREEVQKVFGNRLSLRPGFTLEKLISDYQEGLSKDLTPRYTKVSDLIRSYEGATNKAIADYKFFQYLGDNGMISTSSKAPSGWITLDPDRFPKVKLNIEGEKYTGAYKAPPEIATRINNYLSNPAESEEWLTKNISQVADFASRTKNRMLSFGIPGTAINFHGWNILQRSYLEGGPMGALKTAYYMVNPNAAGKFVSGQLDNADDAVKNGLSISTHEYKNFYETGVDESFKTKFGEKWNQYFEKPLFEKLITAKKIEGWNKLWQEYAKKMPAKEAKHEAAKFINTMYGGINWEEMGRSRSFQNILRVGLLTPDWLESNLRLGAGMVKSLLNPSNPAGAAYRRSFTNLVALYAVLNVVNKMTSGKLMVENEPGHTFEVQAGYTDEGKIRYLRPFGTAVDFLRLPVDAVQGALKGDLSVSARIVRNRLSTFVQPVISLLANTNWKGQPIYGKDKYGNPLTIPQQLAGIGGEISTLAGVPAFLREFADFATGKQGFEEAMTQGFEFPFRYAGGAYGTAQKQVQDITKKSGEELYKQNQMLAGQSKFSEKQLLKIATGGLDEILQKRATDKTMGEIKKKIEAGEPISNLMVNPDTYDLYYGVNEIANMPTTSLYEKGLKEKAAFTKAMQLLKDTDIPEDEKKRMYEKMGLSKEEIDYYNIANDSTDIKTSYLMDRFATLKTGDRTGMLDIILQGRRELNGNMIASNAVIDNLYNQGLISNSERKTIKDFVVNYKTKNIKAKLTGRGKSSSLKKIKFVPLKLKVKGASKKAKIRSISLKGITHT